MMSNDLKEYVDKRIRLHTFYAKNFDNDDMALVDKYCKTHFGNDRKKMILTLISLVEQNTGLQLLEQKINYLSAGMLEDIDTLYKEIAILKSKTSEETEEPKKMKWKGFGNNDNNK